MANTPTDMTKFGAAACAMNGSVGCDLTWYAVSMIAQPKCNNRSGQIFNTIFHFFS